MFKLLLLALVAVCAALCQATPLQRVDGSELAEQVTGDALEVLPETEDFTGRELLGRRKKHHARNKFLKRLLKKFRKGRKGRKGKGRKGKGRKGKGKKGKGKKGKKSKKGKKAKKSKKPKKSAPKKVAPKKAPKKKAPKKEAPKKVFPTKRTTTVTSSAKCKAVAVAGAFSATRPVIVEAAADVLAAGCANDGKIDAEAAVDAYAEAANAVAQAFAATLAKCTTSGNAIGCAAAKSKAFAAAKETGEVMAEAIAVAKSTCDHCLVDVHVVSAAFTQDWLDVYVEAEAKASSYVCVSGDATAVDYEACFAEQIGGLFAKATAEAFVKSYTCYDDANAEAAAAAEVAAGTFLDTTQICKSKQKIIHH